MTKILITLGLITFSSIVFGLEEDLGTIQVNEVKGNKDEKSFLQSTESISILKSKSLNRADLQNSIQMLNGFANVQTQSDRGGETFSIRGISDMGVTGVQKDNLASILVDDVFQTTLAVRAGAFENWDLESVEIHRGSQSTTQGVNSLAGNILLYHHKPQAENGGDAKLTLGNDGRKEAAVVVNHAVTNKLAVRLSYNKEYTDGFITNTRNDNDKYGAKNKDHFVTDFLYQLNSSEELRLNIKLLRMNRGASYVHDYKKYEVTEGDDYQEITNNQQLGLTHTKKISDKFSNKMIIGSTRGDSHSTSDEDGSVNGPVQAGTREINDKDSFFSVEEQFKFKSKNIRNLAGLHFHRYHLNNYYDQNLITGFPAPNQTVATVQENDKVRNTFAVFNTFSFDLGKHHTVDVGGRYEVVKNDVMVNIKAAAPFSALSTKQDDTITNAVLLPKLAYNYHNGNYNLGASYNQGYRTGGITVNRAQSSTSGYDPEKTHNYELSYKYMENKFLFAANVFYTKWKNQQVDVRLSNTQFDNQILNAASSELYGAEFEGSYLLPNADSIRLNAGYVHSQFLSFRSSSTDYTGKQFPDAAAVTGQASYWKVINDNWRVIIIERYVGESFTNPENDRWAPEQFYTDINGQYNFDQYMLELYMRNLFDQKYRLLNGSPRSATYPANYHRVSAPQEFGARLNYFW